ncbi:hypothetical protein BJX70DRAFT_291990 [Aspergillus crustosus]
MNWTGGRLRRHSEINGKSRKQIFGKSSAPTKGPHQITLFNSLSRDQNVKKSGTLGDTANRDNRASHPQPPPSTGNAPPDPPNRLEKMKRQLLEQDDWGAVGAARPVQVDFTAQEDLERFGKRRRLTMNDHERLNMSTMARPRGHEGVHLEGIMPENLEIKINGRRIGDNDVQTNESNKPVSTSSQSMLLDENSFCSSHKADALDSPQNSAARSASMLSTLSDSSYLRELSTALGRSNVSSLNQGLSNPAPEDLVHNDFSDLMEGVSDQPVLEPMLSTDSSSIMAQPESPVRKRFTIDDQEIANRQGRFMVSSPVPRPLASQPLFMNQQILGQRDEACLSSPEPASQPGSAFDIRGQRDSIAGPSMATWLPRAHPSTQRSGSHQAVAGPSSPRNRDHTDFPWMANREWNAPQVTISGQPVVAGESQAGKEALRDLAREDMGLDLRRRALEDYASGEAGSPYSRHRYPFDQI